jgi:hypothetical protein
MSVLLVLLLLLVAVAVAVNRAQKLPNVPSETLEKQ